MKHNSEFTDIFEELTWQMFQMSEGNPYIAQELVVERNKQRNIEKNSKQMIEK